MTDVTWTEFRIEREGRRGWELSLPCFSDDEHPEDAARMNRFYETAAEEMVSAAGLETKTDARLARYLCRTEVSVLTGEEARSEAGSDAGNDIAPKKRRSFFPKPKKPKSFGGKQGAAAGDIRVELRLELAVSGKSFGVFSTAARIFSASGVLRIVSLF